MQEAIGSNSSEAPAAGSTALEPAAAAILVVVTTPSWAQPFRDFLVDDILPQGEVQAQQIQHRSGAYTVINNELVHHSTIGILQRCVEPDKGLELL